MRLSCVQKPAIQFQIFDKINVRIFVQQNRMRRQWLVVEPSDYPELCADPSVRLGKE